MNHLIDCSYYYTGPLQIQNAQAVDDLDNNAMAVQDAIKAYIARYQSDYLDKIVGEQVAEAISEHLRRGEEDAGYCNERMEVLCSRLRLPFAHYVYYKMVGDVNQTMTVTGLMKLKSANENQPVRNRMVKVWNDMVDLHKKFLKWADTSSFEVFYQSEMVTYINQFNL